MYEEKPTTWEWRAGYDYATEKYKSRIDELERFAELGRAEIDRLREENATQDKHILEWGDRYADLSNETDRLRAEDAEMRQILTDLLNDDFEYNWPDRARAILAKTAKEGE